MSEPGAGGAPRSPHEPEERPAAPLFGVDRKVVVLLAVGMVAALLIFWFAPSYTLRYAVVGVLGGLYVLLRFNDWR